MLFNGKPAFRKRRSRWKHLKHVECWNRSNLPNTATRPRASDWSAALLASMAWRVTIACCCNSGYYLVQEEDEQWKERRGEAEPWEK
jgi:hypothetical protein